MAEVRHFAPRPSPLHVFPQDSVSSLQRPITKVTSEGRYSFYGSFDIPFLVASTTEFIATHCESDSEVFASCLDKFLTLASSDCSETSASLNTRTIYSCWLTIRVWHPTTEYVQPRWHRDGRMFDCTCPVPQIPHSKYALVLHGPSTRVLTPSAAVDDVYASIHLREPEKRGKLAEVLAGFEEPVVELGQMIRFSWGQQDSPVHSEPDCTGSDRVFLSVLFGSEEELRDMCLFRGEMYGHVS